MRRLGKLIMAIAACAALLALPAAAGAAPQARASCAPATDIEAIVDDSGSMAITDENKLRVQAMNLLIATLDPSTQLGAVEFGGSIFSNEPSADTVFGPEAVGANAKAMRAALAQKINADNGTTDYNAAFAQSDADNPGANARVFLTDGGHDVGAYNEGHLVHNVPTYVIGFGGIAAGEDQARLQKIADDTGGKYFPLKEASQLQAVMNDIGAALTCQTPPRQFTDLLRQGQDKVHSVAIGAATRSIQITLSWNSPLDKFKLRLLKLVNRGRPVAVAPRRKPAKLKLTRTVGSTFTVVKVAGLRKGQLFFTVKATKVGSGAPKVSLTTQVGQSSHR